QLRIGYILAGRRGIEDWGVEEIQSLAPELELKAFRQGEILEHGEVERLGRRTEHGLRTQVAAREGRSELVSGDVEPLVRSASSRRRLIGAVAGDDIRDASAPSALAIPS